MAEPLAQRVAILEQLVAALQKQLSSVRNALPVGVRTDECILNLDQNYCPKASPYRYQKGCRATACRTANSVYYNHKSTVVPVVVAPTKKKSAPSKFQKGKK